MNYQPKTWEYTINKENGNRVYIDDRLNKVQQNLKTLFDLIDDIRVDSNTNLLYVQNNVNTKTVKDPTVQIVGLIVSKVIEGLGVVFPAGEAPAIIATILFKLTSSAITIVCNPQSKDSYNKVQDKVNDIKLAMDEVFTQVELKITHLIENLESEWNKEFLISLNSDEKVSVSELGNYDSFFPEKHSTDYIMVRESLTKDCTYLVTKILLPVKWKIKSQRAFPTDGIGNILKGWIVEYYKVYNRNTWDKWVSSKEFPDIPSYLKDDIEGPYINDEQCFMSWSESSIDYKKSINGKWMDFSGRNQRVEKDNKDLVKGTSFLDLIQDILRGFYFSSGQFSYDSGFPDYPSYYLWYETKRLNEDVTIVNDKRIYTLIGNSACKDWVYDSNSIFTWGRAYRGIKLNHYYLVDENNQHASDELCKWLFKDNGHYFDKISLKDGRLVKGYITNQTSEFVEITDLKAVGYKQRNKYKFKTSEIDEISYDSIINDDAIATKKEVYIDWGLNFN